MRNRVVFALFAATLCSGLVVAQTPRKPRLNPVIELLEQKKPVFGLYAPSNRRGRPGGPGAPGAPGGSEARAHDGDFQEGSTRWEADRP